MFGKVLNVGLAPWLTRAGHLYCESVKCGPGPVFNERQIIWDGL